MVKAKKREGRKTKMQNTNALRTSVSFPPELYRTLEGIAKRKKVSLAWVVRDAAEKYVADQWPLFKNTHE
ncbi:MAG: CopG family transcriptional regulator [Nitrospirota bacterium]